MDLDLEISWYLKNCDMIYSSKMNLVIYPPIKSIRIRELYVFLENHVLDSHHPFIFPYIDMWDFVCSVVSAPRSASLPPSACHQPTATNKLSPTNCHQPIATHQLLPTLSSTNCQQPIATDQSPPNKSHQPIVPNQCSTNQLPSTTCLLQGVGCTPRCWLGLLGLRRCAAVICVMYAPVLAGAAGSPPLRRCDLRGICVCAVVTCMEGAVLWCSTNHLLSTTCLLQGWGFHRCDLLGVQGADPRWCAYWY